MKHDIQKAVKLEQFPLYSVSSEKEGCIKHSPACGQSYPLGVCKLLSRK